MLSIFKYLLLSFNGFTNLTRQAQNTYIYIKALNTTQYGIRSIHHNDSTLWNSLSNQAKLLPSLSSFHNHIVTATLNEYSSNIY